MELFITVIGLGLVAGYAPNIDQSSGVMGYRPSSHRERNYLLCN